MEVLLAKLSGGITVEIQSTESFDLIQQFDLRQMSLEPNDRKQKECWFNNQVDQHLQDALIYRGPDLTCLQTSYHVCCVQMSIITSEMTSDPTGGSEVLQAELEVLRRRIKALEEELSQLQALVRES